MASDTHGSPTSSRDRFSRGHRSSVPGRSSPIRDRERDRDRDPDRDRDRNPRGTDADGDWLVGLMKRTEDDAPQARSEEAREASEGAFNVLARFVTSSSRTPSSPLSRWRRSAIRIAANSTSRKLREAARLKALQRTPYPLVLARIKLLLDRLTVFKEHVTAVSGGAHSSSLHHSSSRGRRRVAAGSASWHEAGLSDGVGRTVVAAAAAAVAASAGQAAAESGEGDGADERLVTSAIKSWDLRKAGGHLPSGPMENLLYCSPDNLSRRPSRVTRESRSPVFSDDEEDVGTGLLARLRRSPSPSRSMFGGTISGAYSGQLGSRSANGGGGDAFDEALLAEFDGGMALDDPGSGNKMSLDKLLEELSTTMSYVSDFLRNVPEETRMEACFAAKMDNYKKDQTVYRIGDPPERFHLILTGVVEIWTHPPGNRREKTLIATLKKGQSFGEMAILNDEPRAEVATPTSNCTFLTFQRADLLSCFGQFFRDRLVAAEKFFHSQVAVFQALPKHHTMKVISHMMQSTFPAGKDWEPLADQQIYFIKSGTVTLEALDRRVPAAPLITSVTTVAAVAAAVAPSSPPAASPTSPTVAASIGATGAAAISATRGANAAAVSAAVGGAAAIEVPEVPEENEVLAAISIVDGRAVGTLGHEDELRRLRRAAIPKKTVAILEPGAHFGGGARVLGEGELQSCMKVTANTEITVYHMHIDQFFKCASPDLVRALRDDTAFKLTYYFGRLGTIGQDIVVGHAESSLASVRGQLQVGEDEESALAQARGANGPRRKKGGKKLGGHSTEVEKVLSYMAELQAELDNPGSKNLDLYKNGTPAERYYRNPLLCGTARGNALPNLIAGVYSEGLAPLADKVDALAAKAARRLEQYSSDPPAVRRVLSIMAPATPSSSQNIPSPSGMLSRTTPSQRLISLASATLPAGGGGGGSGSQGPGARPISPARVPSRLGTIRASASAADGGGTSTTAAAPDALPLGTSPLMGSAMPGPAAAGATAVHGGGAAAAAAFRTRPFSSPHSASLSLAASNAGGEGDGGGGGGGGRMHGDDMPPRQRSGALTASGFIWQRMRDLGGRAPPQVRQCLTYDEISYNKKSASGSPSPSPSPTPTGPRLQLAGSLSTTQSGFLPLGVAAAAAAAAAAGGGGSLGGPRGSATALPGGGGGVLEGGALLTDGR